MKKIAILVCLAMLISLFAMTASAAEVVTSNVDFTTMDVADAGDASKAAMEAAGLVIPEGSQWHIVDHFYHVAMPKDGYQRTFYIQTLDAGEGKVLTQDAVMNMAYMLAATNLDGSEYDVGWVVVSVSTDGENYTEVFVDEEGQGKMYDPSCIGIKDITLTGTAGASKVWVMVEVERHGGESSGAIGWTKISGTAAREGEVSHVADFTALPTAGAGAESNAALEALGLIIPEGSDWHIVDHFSHCIIPKEGYQKTYYIQTLDAGEGKVLAEDAVMDLSYALAAQADDPGYTVGWIVVSVSTDGENFTEVWVDDEGQGKMYDASAFADEKITLTGTAGASKIWVQVELERHAGETSGLIKTSILSGLTTAASGGGSDETGDMIGVVVALLAVSGLGITVLKKKEN